MELYEQPQQDWVHNVPEPELGEPGQRAVPAPVAPECGPSSAEAEVVNALRSLDVASADIERYGVHPDQYIEWYGPKDGAPVVLWHGGYFYEDGTLCYLRPAAYALGEAGYRVALPEYRRMAGNQAVTFEDSETLARHPELEDAVWIGHSAGAVPVVRALLMDDLPVRHAVALSPILDLAQAAREDTERIGVNPVLNWMQVAPEEHLEAYLKWEPRVLYSLMGAAGFQRRGLTLDIIHGALDQTVPVQRTRDLMGEPFNIAIVPGENHSDVVRPGSDAWLLLLGALK